MLVFERVAKQIETQEENDSQLQKELFQKARKKLKEKLRLVIQYILVPLVTYILKKYMKIHIGNSLFQNMCFLGIKANKLLF